MRFAAAQTIPEPGNVQANVQHHRRLVELATGERVDVIVFPELSLTGYELELGGALAFSQNDERLSPLRELAVAHGITLIVGAPVSSGAERLTIGAFICYPDGRLGLYEKQHLGTGEETAFKPGGPTPLVQLDGLSAAVAICADASHPSHAKQASGRGAKSYLVSAFVVPDELPKKVERLGAYARLHAMPVVFANYGASSGGLPSGGSSAIWSDHGQLIAQLGVDGAGLAMASRVDGAWVGSTVRLP